MVALLVDDREKREIPFPEYFTIWDRGHPGRARTRVIRLVTDRRRLPTADYVCGLAPTVVGIERKANLDELFGNLCMADGRRRFRDELLRMSQEFTRPYLFLEGTPLDLQRVRGPHTNPSIVRDILNDYLLEFGVSLLMLPTGTIPQRRAAGEWLASLLISGMTRVPREPINVD